MANSTVAQVAILKNELEALREDIHELKASNRRLEQFMYRFEGGKAWMFGLLAIAATMGGLISTLAKYIFIK